MKANESYTEESTSLGNLKDTTVSSISNRPHNFRFIASRYVTFTTKTQKQVIQQHLETRNFKAEIILIYNRNYICYFHRKFCQMSFKYEGPQCKLFDLRIIRIGQ